MYIYILLFIVFVLVLFQQKMIWDLKKDLKECWKESIDHTQDIEWLINVNRELHLKMKHAINK